MQKLTLWILALLSCLSLEAHSGKARFHVLIDTDGAPDDLRTICMLLSNQEVEVLSITTSEGALTPQRAAIKVTALLRQFHHQGIPVAAGKPVNAPIPAWRQHSEQAYWGNENGIKAPERPAHLLIAETIKGEEEKVTVICLGSLTNLRDALIEKPALAGKIERILWYNSTTATVMSGANYDVDRSAADNILSSGVRVDIISASEYKIPINKEYIQLVANVNNVYSQHIVDSHSAEALKPLVEAEHMTAWDDLVAIYLFAPELFNHITVSRNVNIYYLPGDQAAEAAVNTIELILKGKPDSESRVFYGFPTISSLYAQDVEEIMNDAIKQYGESEWRAAVLTNELHGHLGIYATVGVKMGIRAREFFNIGVDDINVVTYAGNNPPVSCMNDGLQVSTGGTLGHGLIKVSDEKAVRPEASFTFKDKTIRMKLKQEYADLIKKDVKEAALSYGDLTEDYWAYIRILAIKYWKEFDRHQIFDLYTE